MKFALIVLVAMFAFAWADVSELPSQEYLPPGGDVGFAGTGEIGAAGGGFVDEGATFGDDGYRYKTVRRLKFRRRRY